MRDLIHTYITRILNPFRIALPHNSEVLKLIEDFSDELWYKASSSNLRNIIYKHIRLINTEINKLNKEERNKIKGIFINFVNSTEKFFHEKLHIKLDLLNIVTEHRVSIKVLVDNEPIPNCNVSISPSDFKHIPIAYVTNKLGMIQVYLPRGKYIITILKQERNAYVYYETEVNVTRDIDIVIPAYRKELRPPIPPTEKLKVIEKPKFIELQLPLLPLGWQQAIDVHEKWMQMAFAAQLRCKGRFLNKRIIDARHTFTGFKSSPLLQQLRYDPDLRGLIVTKEMDVLSLTDDHTLIGFEFKSWKGLSKHDYGIEDAMKYYYYGIEYVYIVHRRINNEDFHRGFLNYLESSKLPLGYAIYEPTKLTILREAKLNPEINDSGVKRRGDFIKKYFIYAGGVKGPELSGCVDDYY